MCGPAPRPPPLSPPLPPPSAPFPAPPAVPTRPPPLSPPPSPPPPLDELSCGGVMRGTTAGRISNYAWDPYGTYMRQPRLEYNPYSYSWETSNSLAPPGIPQWGQYSGDKFIRFTTAGDDTGNASYMFDCCNSTFDTYLHVLTDDGNYTRI